VDDSLPVRLRPGEVTDHIKRRPNPVVLRCARCYHPHASNLKSRFEFWWHLANVMRREYVRAHPTLFTVGCAVAVALGVAATTYAVYLALPKKRQPKDSVEAESQNTKARWNRDYGDIDVRVKGRMRKLGHRDVISGKRGDFSAIEEPDLREKAYIAWDAVNDLRSGDPEDQRAANRTIRELSAEGNSYLVKAFMTPAERSNFEMVYEALISATTGDYSLEPAKSVFFIETPFKVGVAFLAFHDTRSG